MGLQRIQLLTLFSQERVFVSLHLNGHVNLVRNLMYESLWFLKRGVWNMLPLPGMHVSAFWAQVQEETSRKKD